MNEINWRNSDARHAAYGLPSRLAWLDVPPELADEDAETGDVTKRAEVPQS